MNISLRPMSPPIEHALHPPAVQQHIKTRQANSRTPYKSKAVRQSYESIGHSRSPAFVCRPRGVPLSGISISPLRLPLIGESNSDEEPGERRDVSGD